MVLIASPESQRRVLRPVSGESVQCWPVSGELALSWGIELNTYNPESTVGKPGLEFS